MANHHNYPWKNKKPRIKKARAPLLIRRLPWMMLGIIICIALLHFIPAFYHSLSPVWPDDVENIEAAPIDIITENQTTPIAQQTPIVLISPSPPKEISIPEPPIIEILPGDISSIEISGFNIIDKYALETPESVAISIESLAAYLIQPTENDFQKTRAIYRWITQNISYDFSAYLTNNYSSTRAEDVLISRSSVCQGYSSLFNALAKSAGLEVVTIIGWAKGYSYNAGDKITGTTNHAWNAVQINGGWYLIDSTWGAGAIIEQRFVREFNEYYFLSPPDRFIYNHLPVDSKWQLLSTPVSKSEFSILPCIHSGFFLYDIDLRDNTESVIETDGNLTMIFGVPSKTYLIARLRQGDIGLPENLISERRIIKKSGNEYQINIRFPENGTYILYIFASESKYDIYEGVLEYKIIFNRNLNP